MSIEIGLKGSIIRTIRGTGEKEVTRIITRDKPGGLSKH